MRKLLILRLHRQRREQYEIQYVKIKLSKTFSENTVLNMLCLVKEVDINITDKINYCSGGLPVNTDSGLELFSKPSLLHSSDIAHGNIVVTSAAITGKRNRSCPVSPLYQ